MASGDVTVSDKNTSSSDNTAEALESVASQWNAAAAQWNPDRLSDIYTEDALFFGGKPEIFVGKEHIRHYFQHYAAVIQSAKVTFSNQHIRKLAPDVVLAQGFGRFEVTLVDNTKSDTLQRTTWVMVKRDGQWKLAQHHFSSPPAA